MSSPTTLLTRTPTEGQALARRLADDLLATLPAPATVAAHVQTGAARPSPELVAAIYFHAISLANRGWIG